MGAFRGRAEPIAEWRAQGAFAVGPSLPQLLHSPNQLLHSPKQLLPCSTHESSCSTCKSSHSTLKSSCSALKNSFSTPCSCGAAEPLRGGDAALNQTAHFHLLPKQSRNFPSPS